MKAKVLFLCTENACRSQMAEGFLRHLAKYRFDVFSAGIRPGKVNPLAVKAMKEEGVDISTHKSKSVNEYLGFNFDYVITVCNDARQSCPVFPQGYEHIHWDLEDPSYARGSEEQKLVVFRQVRDTVKRKIEAFIAGTPLL